MHKFDESIGVNFWLDRRYQIAWSAQDPGLEPRLAPLFQVEGLEIVDDSQVIDIVATG